MNTVLLNNTFVDKKNNEIPKKLERMLRRADNFTRLCVNATQKILTPDINKLIKDISPEDIAIILATRFGPIETNFRYLDTIFDFGEQQGSPTLFSHSVHNTASGYISRIFNFQGPIYNISSYTYPLFSALFCALKLMEQDLAKIVLIIEAETKSILLDDGINRILKYNCQTNILQTYSYAIAWLLTNQNYITNNICITDFKLEERCNNLALSTILTKNVTITINEYIEKTILYNTTTKFTKCIEKMINNSDNCYIRFDIKSEIGYIYGKIYKNNINNNKEVSNETVS